jgi:K+:H+ antiporter subunit KhtT
VSQHHPVPVRLPGVGTQLDVRDDDGRLITAIRRVDGHVELYQGERAIGRLDEASADALGAFLSGHIVMPSELASRMADVLGGLELDWVRLPADAHAAGRTIGELEVRRRTGVTIVAVLRGSVPIVAVDADTVLRAGDELVYTGRSQDGDAFRTYVLRGV